MLALFAVVITTWMIIQLPIGTAAQGTGDQAGIAIDLCAGVHSLAGPTGPAPASLPSLAATPDPAASCHPQHTGPSADDFISINAVTLVAKTPAAGPNGSTGTFTSYCGLNENQHRNPDNFLTLPGVTNGAHHTHDYVGNLSTDAFTTDASLAAAGTTCQLDDLSTYFWPVLRRTDTTGRDNNAPGAGLEGNIGEILQPTSVALDFLGNPQSKVVAMPRFLKMITGDATAATTGLSKARAQWTCSGFTDRIGIKYPLCPDGKGVQRILVFPSCWDGKNIDSTNHRTHVVFPAQNGACPANTQAIPQLRITLVYNVPAGPTFAVDTFPEQKRSPVTDHGVFCNVMPDRLMNLMVNCINSGLKC
jgi:hypothetical protein